MKQQGHAGTACPRPRPAPAAFAFLPGTSSSSLLICGQRRQIGEARRGPAVVAWRARGTSPFTHKSGALWGDLLWIPLPPPGSAGLKTVKADSAEGCQPGSRGFSFWAPSQRGFLIAGRGLRCIPHPVAVTDSRQLLFLLTLIVSC